MKTGLNIRDMVTIKLASMLKYDEHDFIKCKWNDIIIKLLNAVGSDPAKLLGKLVIPAVKNKKITCKKIGS